MRSINANVDHQQRAGKAASVVLIAKLRGSGSGYVKVYGRHLHRRLAEEALGRPLLPHEVVHHVDNDPRHNHRHNLLICTQAYHAWLHTRMKALNLDPRLLLPEEARCCA